MDVRISWRLILSLMVIGFLLASAPGALAVTEVGTPRAETLIVDQLDGRIVNAGQFNPYMPGTSFSAGFHQMNIGNLWEVNTVTGEQFPSLAAEMAEPLNDDFTAFRIHLRDGLYWSDGVKFTADDLYFTIRMILDTPELPYSGFLSGVISEVEQVDELTVDIQTTDPYPRIERTLGAYIWGTGFRIVPKHIWEDVDPTTFMNNPPVGVGPYTLADYDRNGNWFLWERREDWERSDVGIKVGKPGPKYVLFRYYGPEEIRVLSGIRHDLDVFQDITPESWEILQRRNEYARAWYEHFPYANLDDPCERGIAFNNSEFPYNHSEVRWALALATDIQRVSLATFAGMLRVSPLAVPPVKVLQDAYHKPMRDWLMDFAFEDGYKPFDPDYAMNMAAMFQAEGMEGIPTDEDEIIDLFGVGWWRHDPDKAAELLEGVGFTRGANNMWQLPDGTPWRITINAPADFEVQSQRLAFAVAEVWRGFGIDANVQQMDGGSFWNSWGLGTFDAGSYWPGCGLGPDVFTQLQGWHQQYVAPRGTHASGNQMRHDSDRLSAALDALRPLTSADPQIVPLTTELLKVYVEEMPWLPMFGTSKFVPVDTYYWEGFPTADNHYEGPWWWWSLFKYIMPHLEPTGR